MQAQKLALLALGGRTTMFYVRIINELFQQKNGGVGLCPLLVKKTDFEKINQLLPNQFFQLESIVESHLQRLNSAEKIIIPNITLHETLDRIAKKTGQSYPVVHPVKSIIVKLASDGCKKIMLIGSQYSMNSSYLMSYFERVGINVSVPTLEDQEKIDNCRQKIYSFAETRSDIDQYRELIDLYKQTHKIVIACTELSLMLPSVDDHIYDMTRIQIKEAMTVYDEA